MAITTNDQLVAALATKLSVVPYSPQTTPTLVAGRLVSLWTIGSILGGVGAVPSAGAGDACDNTTAGGVPIPPVTGGDTLYLLPLQLAAGAACAFYVIDRLVATSGLSGTSTGAQPVNTVALPSRAAGGVGVGAALVVYTAAGATAPATITMTYTNSAGVSGRVGVTPFTAALNQTRYVVPLALQAGDVGVQSVQSIQLGTNTTTAGNLGVSLYRWISREGLISAGGGQTGQTIYDQGLPVVDTTACLELWLMPPATTFPQVFGGIPFAAG